MITSLFINLLGIITCYTLYLIILFLSELITYRFKMKTSIVSFNMTQHISPTYGREHPKLTIFISFTETWALYSSILVRISSSDSSFVPLASSSLASFCCKDRGKLSVGSASSAIRFTLTSRWCCFLMVHRLPGNKTDALRFAQFHELTSETTRIVRMHFSQQGFERNGLSGT